LPSYFETLKFLLKKKQNVIYNMATDDTSTSTSNDEYKINQSSESLFYTNITKQLEDILSVLKQIHNTCIQFQETDREFVSEESILLEESLSKERTAQEIEHEALRTAFRQKTDKEQKQNQARILRKARSLVAEQNKNSQVWD